MTVANNQWQQTDTSPVSKGEEEEESEVIEIYPQQSMLRQNPPRSQKPQDKLTY